MYHYRYFRKLVHVFAGLESGSLRSDTEYCFTADWTMCAMRLIAFKATIVL